VTEPTWEDALASALAERRAGRMEAAERILQDAVHRWPTGAELWYWLAVTLDNQGMESTAVPAYREALRMGCKRQAEAHAYLASSLEKTWRADEALPHIEEALRAAPRAALFWVILGNVAAARGATDDADAAYRRAVALDPGLGWAWHQLGQWQGLRGCWDEAAGAFARARDLGYRG
jgi:protein O-GlcNAc transferase